jgi:hypothetical protein
LKISVCFVSISNSRIMLADLGLQQNCLSDPSESSQRTHTIQHQHEFDILFPMDGMQFGISWEFHFRGWH